ncbi:hypothetical protein [Shewanella sp. MM_2022_3]|uniref:hypothetical protein n=1 Tax=Shewanella sp. MM_2022_3 TaxID=2923280 RepID=UPI001F4BD0F9|nr:hypothetical protein [Shewanella sp. MM_2022_3]MCH7424986.1 hypothetical protein [Shewanella sp. MM_2022_3]
MLIDDLEKRTVSANFLFEMRLGDHEYYYTDCPFNLELEGQVYSHLNIVKKLDNSKETSKLDSKGIKLTLVGLDDVILKRFIDTDVLGGEITVLIAFREGGRITSTYVYSSGYIDKAKLKSSDKSTDLIIETSSKFRDIKSKASSRTNQSEQLSRYPNDNFYKYAAQTDMDVNWGKDK